MKLSWEGRKVGREVSGMSGGMSEGELSAGEMSTGMSNGRIVRG